MFRCLSDLQKTISYLLSIAIQKPQSFDIVHKSAACASLHQYSPRSLSHIYIYSAVTCIALPRSRLTAQIIVFDDVRSRALKGAAEPNPLSACCAGREELVVRVVQNEVLQRCDRGREGFRLPSLRTVLAVFPHTALQLLVSTSGTSRSVSNRG